MSYFKIILLTFVILFSSGVSAQNLKGVTEYTLIVHYSDESKNFNTFLPSASDIKKKVLWEIPELKYSTTIGFNYNYVLIFISYNYYRNYEEIYNKQYYGTISIEVYRKAIIKGSSDEINARVFGDQTFFVMNNPMNETVMQDADQTISHLITSFGKYYYEEN